MTRAQFRAMALAAIMVLSVVAMGAGFVGGAAGQDAGSDEVVVLDENGDQIDTAPFDNVQTAVDNSQGGYTVVVGDGTYEEDVTVDVEISLRSADGATPTVEGIVTLAAPGVTVDGLTVDGGTSNAAPIDVQAGDVTVSNNTVVGGAASGGISTWSGSGPVVGEVSIRDNTIENGAIGLVVDSQSTDIDIRDNEINGASSEGIWLSDFTNEASISEADITVQNNDISDVELADIKIEQDAPSSLNGNEELVDPNAVAETFLTDSNAETVQLWDGQVYNENGNLVVQDGDSVQTAIDAAEPGETIDVYPGTYEEIAEERDAYGSDNQPYSFGLYVGSNDLTIRGVTTEGEPITDAENVQAEVISTASSTFGTNGPFISAEDTTIQGLEITPNPDASPNKNIEVGGDNLSLDSNIINGDIGSVYFNTGEIQSFSVVGNQINAGVSVNNGVGNETAANNRIVEGNEIGLMSFAGEDPDVDWRNHAIGAVTIKNNTIRGHSYTLEYEDNEGNQQTYVYQGVFNRVGSVTQPTDFTELFDDNTVLRGSYIENDSEPTGIENLGTNSAPTYEVAYSAQESVDTATEGDTVVLENGTYTENVTLNTKNVTLRGSGESVIDGRIDITTDGVAVEDLTVRNGAPSASNEVEGIFVGDANDFDNTDGEVRIHNVTVEDIHSHGTDKTAEAIHVKQYGGDVDGVTISETTLRNVTQPDAGANGIKLQAGVSDVTVTESTISDIEGSWAYGISSTPSSAETGVPTNANITENTITNISAIDYDGVGVGIDGADGSFADPTEVELSRNNFSDNGIAVLNKNSDETLDATFNWWGDATGPDTVESDTVVGNVTYDPFLTIEANEIGADSVSDTADFGHDLVVPADGDVHTVAFPSAVDGTVEEVFDDFNGTVYAYDGDQWVTGDAIADEEIGALDAFAVSVDEDESDLRIAFEYADDDSEFPSMTTAELDAGWNFVGAPSGNANSDAAFAGSTAEVTTVIDAITGPNAETTPYGLDASGDVSNPDRVSPFKGYWVFVTDDGELGATVPVEPTQGTEEGALTGN